MTVMGLRYFQRLLPCRQTFSCHGSGPSRHIRGTEHMNFFRKSSLILAGAAATGLLVFACSGGDDTSSGSSAADLAVHSSLNDLLVTKVYAGGGGDQTVKGDYVEIFNPTAHAIPRKLLSLQLADAQGAFSKGYILSLAAKDDEATIASGHYFLVSLTPGADLGGITADLEAAPIVPADGGATLAFGLDVTGGSVALVNSEDPLDCDQPSNCRNLPNVKSVFGYGKIADDAPFAEKQPFAALSTTTAAVRKVGGCYAIGSSAADFELTTDTKPFDPAVGLDCSTVDAGMPDAGAEDSGAEDGGAADSGSTKDAGPPKTKDAGTKADAGADDGSGMDETPAPTTGKKKKTNANAPVQPIASSDASCAAAPGPIPTSNLAGIAGLGLALAALGRRKKK